MATKRILASLGALLLLLPAVGCSTNPATGKSQFNALSREQAIALGEEASPELIDQYGGLVEDPELKSYMDRVGWAMVPHTEADYPNLPWEFYFLDSDVINAFALPGGKVFVSRGLAEIMENEAQFASVVGHEIGHVTARHINDRVAQQMAIQGLGVGAVILAGQGAGTWAAEAANVVVGTAGQGFMLKFSRDDELEADSLGVRYMVRAGYNPEGAVQMHRQMGQAAGSAGMPEFMSTHPTSSTRIDFLRELIAEEYGYTQNNPEYEFYPQRYQSGVLSRLAQMDVPKHRVPIGAFALHDPTTWCAHCAAEAESATP